MNNELLKVHQTGFLKKEWVLVRDKSITLKLSDIGKKKSVEQVRKR